MHLACWAAQFFSKKEQTPARTEADFSSEKGFLKKICKIFSKTIDHSRRFDMFVLTP